jgi:hypothetical protein
MTKSSLSAKYNQTYNQMSELKDNIIDFTEILKKIRYPFYLVSKYSRLFLIYSAIAVICVIAFKFTLTPEYSASFIISPNEKTNIFYVNMINDIKDLVKAGDKIGLASELKITPEVAKQIKKIDFYPFRIKKTVDSIDAMVITMQMQEIDKFLPVQNSIFDYLENSPYYKKVNAVRLEKIESTKRKLSKELKEIDSVNKLIVTNIKPIINSSSGLVYNVPLDPFHAYEVSMRYFKQEIDLLALKDFAKSFEIIKPCVVNQKPVWPKLNVLLLTGLVIALLVSFLHSNIKENAK